jgi:protein-S-isoprenylcysteine O-methyltransferase Ste14
MGPLPWADVPATFWLGATLVAAALVWVVVAQAQMGNAWRIGIDHQHATALVRHGLFTMSRNPIFLGVRVALLGAVLMVPNAVVLASALAGEVLIQVQVRLEEAHLLQLHRDDYRAYANLVHRWLGRR